MMTKAFGFTVALNARINSQRMGWIRQRISYVIKEKLSIFTL
jgi:hypothetical protein